MSNKSAVWKASYGHPSLPLEKLSASSSLESLRLTIGVLVRAKDSEASCLGALGNCGFQC